MTRSDMGFLHRQFSLSALAREHESGRSRRAFTLIELVVVIIVLGILTYMTTATYNQVASSLSSAAAQGYMDQVRAAEVNYSSQNGGYTATPNVLSGIDRSVTVVIGAVTAPTQVSISTNPSTDQLGMASINEAGICTLELVNPAVTGASVTMIPYIKGTPCEGASALIPTGSQTVNVSGTYDSTMSSMNPTGWWKFTDPLGSTTVTDYANSNANPGYISGTGSVTFGQTGGPGSPADASALLTAPVTITTNLDPSNPPAFTASAWVNLDGATPSAPEAIMGNGSLSSNTGFNVTLGGAGDLYPTVTLTNGTTQQSIVSNTPIDNTSWHNILVSWDGSNITLYVDDSIVGYAPLSGTLPGNSNLVFGQDGTGAQYYTGLISQIALFNTALNSTQVDQLYQAAYVTPTAAGPSITSVTPGSGQATISWTDPAYNSSVTGYVVTSTPGGFSCSTSTGTSCTVTGLTPGQTYTFVVQENSALGLGPASAPSGAVVASLTVPGPPTSLTASTGSTSSTLSWIAPVDNGGSTISGYVVQYASYPYNSWQTATSTATISGYTVTGLNNGTAYEFRVAATNAVGTGPYATTASSVVVAGVPSAPTSVTAVAGSTIATVSWTAPSSNGGAPITSYVVTSSPGGYTCSTTGATSCTVTGLTNGTSYTFTVVAINANGSSLASAPSGPVTPYTVPDAPTGLTATVANASSVVSWSAPATNGGAAITLYTVTSSPGGFTCTASTTLSCTVTGLTNGTSYTFTATATNAAGTGPASTPSNAVVPANVPSAPTAVTAVGGENAQVPVSWTAPSSNGGSPITGYVVTSSPGGLTCNTTSALSCTVIGLTNATTYTFTVVASNVSGPGPASAPSNAATPEAVPGAPTSATATAGNASATVTWVAPASDGGSPITGYTVTSAPGAYTCSTATYSCVVTGLTNGTTYTFTVVAINANGPGPASAPSNAVTPVGLPTAPTNVVGVGGKDSQVPVSWSAPSNDGGSPITAYIVQYSTSPYSSWTTATSTQASSPYTVSGLTNGTSYEFQVAAVNANGTGPFSTPSAPVTPAGLPGAPTNVAAVSGENTQVPVSWSAPASDGGSTITNYTVTASPGGNTCSTSGLSCIVTGLTNGSTYTFTVTATNAAGVGPTSTPSNPATPSTTPGAPQNPSASPSNAEAIVSWTPPLSNGGAVISSYTAVSSPGANSCVAGPTGATTLAVGATLASGASIYSPNSLYRLTMQTDGNLVEYINANNYVLFASNTSGNSGAYAVMQTDGNLVVYSSTGTALWASGTAGDSGAFLSLNNYGSLSVGSSSSILWGGTECVVTGLTNGTSYTFTIQATNISGTGPASAPTNAVTPATVPGPPTGVTGAPGNAQITVAWSAPYDNGGSPITLYTATSSPGGFTCTSTGLTCVVTGLTNGTAYTFTVTATNALGTSISSLASSPATPYNPGLYSFSSFTFNNCGVSGATGPTLAQCLASYNTTANPWLTNTSYYNQVTQGYQQWTVPQTGTYNITVAGAAGGSASSGGYSGSGGQGAIFVASAPLTQGQVLTIGVGQAGGNVTFSTPGSDGGGGGASFVANSSGPFLVAGGGGGAGSGDGSYPVGVNGVNASPYNNTSGSAGIETSVGWAAAGAGGTGGSGGAAGSGGAGGGGISGSGATGSYGGTGGASYASGFVGGSNVNHCTDTWTSSATGGFGGGGGAGSCSNYEADAGGGGGYSGGGGSGTRVGAGGGGGSYLASPATIVSSGPTGTQLNGYVNVSLASGASAPALPTAPTNVSATPGDTLAQINWSAPTSNGGTPVTLYTVLSWPGDYTCTSSQYSCVIPGLTNGVAYTFTVTATTANGTGPSSAPVGPITPLANSTIGSYVYSVAGTYTFVDPAGVYSVTALAIGGGGGGSSSSATGGTGGTSYFVNTSTLAATGGTGGSQAAGHAGAGGNVTAGVGYPGGAGSKAGGGAGGYGAQGGAGLSATNAGGGGGGTGAYGGSGSGGSGGTDLGGAGASGGGTGGSGDNGTAGGATLNGLAGITGSSTGGTAGGGNTPGTSTSYGGGGGAFGGGGGGYYYGGGGGALAYLGVYAVTPGNSYTVVVGAGGNGDSANAGGGASGVVRIAWGSGRYYPNTGVSTTTNESTTTFTVPGAPTNVTGTALPSAAAISWTAPASGGATVSLYTVTSSPGGLTCTTSTTSCTVSGLTNGTGYTFTVTATNAAGTGPASAPSPVITPFNPPWGSAVYTIAGTYTWTVPANVYSVSVVAVGAGGGGIAAGYGGVTSSVASPTNTSGGIGGPSYFESGSTMIVEAGGGGIGTSNSPGGTVLAGSGYPGGNGAPGSSYSGGAGAGGYGGSGGNSTYASSYPTGGGGTGLYGGVGSGGSGGGSSSDTPGYGASGGGNGGSGNTITGGGVGSGTSVAVVGAMSYNSLGGSNGGGSTYGSSTSSCYCYGGGGGAFGGGGGGYGTYGAGGGGGALAYISTYSVTPGSTYTVGVGYGGYGGNGYGAGGGASGGVRIIWGYNRSYPNTNAGGTSGESVNGAPPITVPGAPLNVTASPGASAAYVNWSAPSSNGGATITSYTATSSPGGYTCTTSGLSCQVTGLTIGTSYTFTVTATNSVGTGPASTPSNAVVPTAYLYPFTSFTFQSPITGQYGPTLAQVTSQSNYTAQSWTSNTNYLSMPVQGYQLWTVPMTSTYQITTYGAGGTNDTYGQAGGSGAWVTGYYNLTAGQQLLILPGQTGTGSNASQAAQYEGGGGGGTFVASGTTPASATLLQASGGGGGAYDYNNSYPANGINASTSTCGTAGGGGIAGGCNGAAGSYGTSSSSAGYSTNGTNPNGSAALSFTNGGTGAQMYLSWGTYNIWGGFGGGGGGGLAAGGGGGYGGGGGGTWTYPGNGGGGGSYWSGSSVTSGITYNPSTNGYVSITQVSVPSAPTNVNALAGDAQATVTWNAPASNGNLSITSYTVTSSPGAFNCTSATTSCTVTGLTNGTSYTFTVTATNALGTGPSSTPSNAVVPALTTPSAPQNVSAVAGNTMATISWSAPSSNGGYPITMYTVTSSPGSYVCTTSGALTCSIVGLTNGTNYAFTVTATNSAGTGPASAPSAAVAPYDTLYPFPVNYSFTFQSPVSGPNGPTLAQATSQSNYLANSWTQNTKYLSMPSYNGYQFWTVPTTGTYQITSVGAGGTNNGYGQIGGDGAVTVGTFSLTKGQQLILLVGQTGTAAATSQYGQYEGGGGGASYVASGSNPSSATLLEVAGGGGGAYTYYYTSYESNGIAATTTNCGANGAGGIAGGCNGAAGGYSYSSASAGYNTNGTNPSGSPALSFTNGGVGAQIYTSWGAYNVWGGFGGGGGGGLAAGGGGGYGGGGGGTWSTPGGGGGGGSYDSGTSTSLYNTYNPSSNGSITVRRLS